MTIQKDIVLRAIERFPRLPNRTLARYILMENGEYFDGDIEKIRNSVRYFSGSCGEKSRCHKREITIPKTLRNKRTPYHLTPGKWLLLFDVHIPYHEPRPLKRRFSTGKTKMLRGYFFRATYRTAPLFLSGIQIIKEISTKSWRCS